jgi:hypothetical protein
MGVVFFYVISLNSINYKSNQHQESFPYELGKIQPKILQRDGVVMMVIKVLVMMVMMMMPMKPSSMMVTMAMISPLLEGISLADFCPPESFLSLCVFCPAEAVESICDPPLGLRFLGRRYTQRGDDRGGPGRPHHQVARPRAGPRQQLVWAPGGLLRPLFLATSIFQQNMNFWVFSWNCWSS